METNFFLILIYVKYKVKSKIAFKLTDLSHGKKVHSVYYVCQYCTITEFPGHGYFSNDYVSSNQSFLSQVLRVIGPLAKKFILFQSLGI